MKTLWFIESEAWKSPFISLETWRILWNVPDYLFPPFLWKLQWRKHPEKVKCSVVSGVKVKIGRSVPRFGRDWIHSSKTQHRLSWCPDVRRLQHVFFFVTPPIGRMECLMPQFWKPMNVTSRNMKNMLGILPTVHIAAWLIIFQCWAMQRTRRSHLKDCCTLHSPFSITARLHRSQVVSLGVLCTRPRAQTKYAQMTMCTRARAHHR